MRMPKFLLVLCLTTSAYACAVPANIQIRGEDPCVLMPLIQTAWTEVLKRAWFTSHVNELFTGERKPLPTEDLAAMGPIRFIAHSGEDFYFAPVGYYVYGVFSPSGTPTIDYASGTPNVLRHEMAHWFYWRYRNLYGERTWLDVGHLNGNDPHWNALKAIEAMYYH